LARSEKGISHFMDEVGGRPSWKQTQGKRGLRTGICGG
jgi:hypothetical protein